MQIRGSTSPEPRWPGPGWLGAGAKDAGARLKPADSPEYNWRVTPPFPARRAESRGYKAAG